jgi:hypothetical protein
MVKAELEPPQQTYEEWETSMLRGYEGMHESWRAVENWLYPGRDNVTYCKRDVVYHVCPANYERLYGGAGSHDLSVTDMERGCLMCGDKVPEGIKMIMLLGKL